jgi:hypothetical protein
VNRGYGGIRSLGARLVALKEMRRVFGSAGSLRSRESVLGRRRRHATRGYDSLLTLARLLGIHQAPFIQQRHSGCYGQAPLCTATRFKVCSHPQACCHPAPSFIPTQKPSMFRLLSLCRWRGPALSVGPAAGNLLTRFHRQERPLHLDSANTFSANHGASHIISDGHALERLSPSPNE